MQIEESQPFDTPYAWAGGEASVRALVDRFYDLMDLEPAYKELRAVHGPDLASARDKLFWFLSGWLGGPQEYTPFAIGILERDQWLACMAQAMGETGLDPALHARLEKSFFQTADWMRNQNV